MTFETLLPHGKQTLAPISHTSKQYYVPAKVLEFHPYTPATMRQSDNRCHHQPVFLLEMMQCGQEQWALEATNLESNPFANVESWTVTSVQSLSGVWLIVTPWTAARQASLSITNSWSLPKLMPIESVMLHLSHPLSSPSPPTFDLSQHQGLFEWVSSSHQVAKALKFQLQHQSFQWIFRTDFL